MYRDEFHFKKIDDVDNSVPQNNTETGASAVVEGNLTKLTVSLIRRRLRDKTLSSEPADTDGNGIRITTASSPEDLADALSSLRGNIKWHLETQEGGRVIYDYEDGGDNDDEQDAA